ncbi:hypothetical protein [Pseudomonas sp. JAI120]|uniref:hypothetical protein n=1 Tax=Pseudomonas sp. JAI120 TaxID=2723063 RepID=UPI0030ECC77D
MARITKAQKAGLDFLDQIFFNELVVHRGMNDEEQQQLETVIKSSLLIPNKMTASDSPPFALWRVLKITHPEPSIRPENT